MAKLTDKLLARLAVARREYAKRRDRYTRALIRWEARVQRLEADLEAAYRADEMPAPGAQPQPPLARKAGRPVRSQHPFPRRVGNVTAWADKNGYPRWKVKSWYSTGAEGRPIPLEAAQLIRQQYGVKLAAWPNGVRK